MAEHNSERASLQQRLTEIQNRFKAIVRSHDTGNLDAALTQAGSIARDLSTLRDDVISAYGPNLRERTAALDSANAALSQSSLGARTSAAPLVDLRRTLHVLQRELNLQSPISFQMRLQRCRERVRRVMLRPSAQRYVRSAKVILLSFIGLVVVLKAGFLLLTMGHGLRATYFKDKNLRQAAVTRVDRTIDFNWKSGSPMKELPNDRFSVRWEGSLFVDKSAAYEFALGSDDGTLLWIDDRLVINNWRPQAFNAEYGIAKLSQGEHSIRVDYFEHSNTAQVVLSWREVGPHTFEVIPARRLKPKK